MSSVQLTILVLESASLPLLIIVASLYAKEKLKRVEKRALFAVAPNDAVALYRTYNAETGNLRLRQFGIAIFTALFMGLVFCISYLDISRTNSGTSLVFLLAASGFVSYTGVFLTVAAMYRIRENRVMLHKFMHRHQSASGKAVYVNLLRQSLYYLDKKAFKRKRKSDFSMKPDICTIFIVASLLAALAFNVVYLIDLLAPV